MILTSTLPHSGYDFLHKYSPVIKAADNKLSPKVGTTGVVAIDPDVKLIVLTGGEDVSPFLYNRSPHATVHFNPARDYWELLLWEAAQIQKIPVLGICRGLQFINVMCGGELVQHTTGHAGRPHVINCLHDSIKEFNGQLVTSLHHQMVILPKGAEILAISALRSHYYLTSSGNGLESKEVFLDVAQEIEAAVYKDQRAVGVQFHPELCRPEHHADIKITQKLIEEYLL